MSGGPSRTTLRSHFGSSAAMIDAMLDALVGAFASLAAMFDAADGRGSAQCGLSPVVQVFGYFCETAAFAWAAAPIALSHLGGLCLVRRMDAASFWRGWVR